MSKLVLQLRALAGVSRPSSADTLKQAANEIERLTTLVNTPMFEPFDTAVKCEAAHQAHKWGTVHDRNKEPQEWYWLVGYLAGKAPRSHLSGDRTKALHHTISSAAVLFHWHTHITKNLATQGPSDLETAIGKQVDLKPDDHEA